MDIERALADGYTKDEVISELGRRTGMNYKQAMSDGYSVDDVIKEMNRRDSASQINIADRKIVDTTNTPQVPKWGQDNPTLYGIIGAGKEVAKFGGETAGVVGGGILGAPLGPVGAAAGAGLGYGGVKALQRFLEGEKATIPQAALTSAKDVVTGAGMEAGGQIAGKVIGGTLERISRPVSGSLPKEVIAERIAKAKELGIELSPAEATGSKGLALYESMLDKSPFSTGIINEWRELKQLKPLVDLRNKMVDSGNTEQVEVVGQKIKEQVDKFLGQYKNMNEDQLNLLRTNILKKMGSQDTYESLGMKTLELIKKRSKENYAAAGELYAKVGEQIPEGTAIRLDNLKKAASDLLESEIKQPPSLQEGQAIRVLKDLSGRNDASAVSMDEYAGYGEDAVRQIQEILSKEGEKGFDWKTIQGIRSRLNTRIANTDAAMKTRQPDTKFQSTVESGIYKQLRKALDEDIETFAKESGGTIKESFDLANAFYKEGKQIYNAPAIRRMLSSNPERIVDMIFRPGGGSEIDLVRNAIGKESFENILKPTFTKRILDTGDVFDPKMMGARIKQYGDEMLAKVYNKDEIKALKELKDNGKMIIDNKLIGNPFLRTIASERPEIVIDSILGSYEKMPSSGKILKNVLLIRSSVDKPTFEGLQQTMSDRIFKLNQLTGSVQPEKLSKTIQTYEKVLKVFYTPEQVSWLKQIAETGRLMSAAEKSAANPSGTAQNVITWGTAGAILEPAIRGKIGGTLAGIGTGILAPKAMANIYLSDAGRRYFTMGLKTPIGTKAGVAIATKLAEIAGNDISTQRE